MEGIAKQLPCVQSPGLRHSDARLKCSQQVPVAECAIHFWQKGLPPGEMFDRLDYMGGWKAVSTHHEVTNPEGNYSSISRLKLIYGNALWSIFATM